MKKLIYSISTAAALFLVGCGGGGSGSTESVTGTVEASYLAGVKVCVKGTDNCAVTDANGKFVINAAAPVTLEIRVGNSVIGDVNASSNTVEVTPAVLADGNATVAAYLGAMMHIIGGCKITDEQCDLGKVTKVDIDNASDEPLVKELMKVLQSNPDANITVKVDDKTVEVTDDNVTLYKTVNPMMVGQKELYYHGIAGGEGLLTFKVDPKTMTLTYQVNDFNGTVESGSEELVNIYHNLFFTFKNNPDEKAFISKTMAVSYYKEGGQTYYNVGLQYPDKNLTAADVKFFANKKYNDIFFDTDGSIDFSIVDLNTSNPADLNGTWTSTDADGVETGTWNVDGDHIVFKQNGSVVAVGFLKPGVSRAAIVYGDVDGGFGIGLEAKSLKADEVKGEFHYSYTDPSSQCFGEVELDGNKGKYKDEYCSDNQPESGSFTLDLNNTTVNLNGTTYELKGVAKVVGKNEYVFIDPDDGYYIAINPTDKSISIGSNKPLK
jgi:hypothetical protein